MKKLIFLILPVLFGMVACQNKTDGSGGTTTTTDSTSKPAAKVDSVATDTTVSGGGSLPAQVFVEGVGTVLPGAVVTIMLNGKVMSIDTANAKGIYACTTLTKGTPYLFIANCKGYLPDSVTAVYDGTPNSLPTMGMTPSK